MEFSRWTEVWICLAIVVFALFFFCVGYKVGEEKAHCEARGLVRAKVDHQYICVKEVK